MSSNKVVRVSYIQEDYFCVPSYIDLEDKAQVKFWGVRYNVLHIVLTNGKEIEIESEGMVNDTDYKCPDGEPEILDADECDWIDEDDDEYAEKFNPIEDLIVCMCGKACDIDDRCEHGFSTKSCKNNCHCWECSGQCEECGVKGNDSRFEGMFNSGAITEYNGRLMCPDCIPPEEDEEEAYDVEIEIEV